MTVEFTFGDNVIEVAGKQVPANLSEGVIYDIIGIDTKDRMWACQTHKHGAINTRAEAVFQDALKHAGIPAELKDLDAWKSVDFSVVRQCGNCVANPNWEKPVKTWHLVGEEEADAGLDETDVPLEKATPAPAPAPAVRTPAGTPPAPTNVLMAKPIDVEELRKAFSKIVQHSEAQGQLITALQTTVNDLAEMVSTLMRMSSTVHAKTDYGVRLAEALHDSLKERFDLDIAEVAPPQLGRIEEAKPKPATTSAPPATVMADRPVRVITDDADKKEDDGPTISDPRPTETKEQYMSRIKTNAYSVAAKGGKDQAGRQAHIAECLAKATKIWDAKHSA